MYFSRSKHLPCCMALLALALAAAMPATGAIFRVGSPVGAGACTHGSIQAAIDAAEANPGSDTVRITRSLGYTAQALSIVTSQILEIEGGYADCTAAADGTNTMVSGSGGVEDSVFHIDADGPDAIVRLRRLTVRDGDVAGQGGGGGIQFQGAGKLEIRDSSISFNTAGYGGGITVNGALYQGNLTRLVIGANVVIGNNVARYSGGGIYASQTELSMLEPGSILSNNEALGTNGNGGYGGGLYVTAGAWPSIANIGAGVPGFGAIYGNSALYGGGVAVDKSFLGGAAQLQVYTADPANQARISFNYASKKGGAIYMADASTYARLWNAVLDNNLAPNGGAVYLASGGNFDFNSLQAPLGVGCAVADCGRIDNNDAATDPLAPGAILYGESGTKIHIGRSPSAAPPLGGVLIRKNGAGSVIAGFAETVLYSTLVSDNTTSGALIGQAEGILTLADATVAGNAIGNGKVLFTGYSDITLQRSILWQPGATTLSVAGGGGSLSVDNLDASDVASLGGGSSVYNFNPRFIDPAHGDYRLRAGSGAIDVAPAVGGLADRDAYGQLRDIDLPAKANWYGSRDLGALERPALQPLVLNGDFGFSDLRLWTKFAGEWDGTQNVTPNAGSGSWKYANTDAPQRDVVVARQCIHLPGPGTYWLSGHGRGGGANLLTYDKAVLGWEFRSAGTESCDSGAATASGELQVGSGPNWGSSGAPARIDVPTGQFGPTSSITVVLIARDGGVITPRSISAWFDDIQLDFYDDLIFADDFE